jgi:hypothetical protein
MVAVESQFGVPVSMIVPFPAREQDIVASTMPSEHALAQTSDCVKNVQGNLLFNYHGVSS